MFLCGTCCYFNSLVICTRSSFQRGPVHITPEKIKNGAFTFEHASNIFRLHYVGGIWKRNVQSAVILDLCLRKTRSRKSHDYRDTIVLVKFRFKKVFRPREYVKPAFSNSSGLKSVFTKAPFSWRISVSDRRNKAAKKYNKITTFH